MSTGENNLIVGCLQSITCYYLKSMLKDSGGVSMWSFFRVTLIVLLIFFVSGCASMSAISVPVKPDPLKAIIDVSSYSRETLQKRDINLAANLSSSQEVAPILKSFWIKLYNKSDKPIRFIRGRVVTDPPAIIYKAGKPVDQVSFHFKMTETIEPHSSKSFGSNGAKVRFVMIDGLEFASGEALVLSDSEEKLYATGEEKDEHTGQPYDQTFDHEVEKYVSVSYKGYEESEGAPRNLIEFKSTSCFHKNTLKPIIEVKNIGNKAIKDLSGSLAVEEITGGLNLHASKTFVGPLKPGEVKKYFAQLHCEGEKNYDWWKAVSVKRVFFHNASIDFEDGDKLSYKR